MTLESESRACGWTVTLVDIRRAAPATLAKRWTFAPGASGIAVRSDAGRRRPELIHAEPGPALRDLPFLRDVAHVQHTRYAGMPVLDDGGHLQPAPEQRFHGTVAHLVQLDKPPPTDPRAGLRPGHRDQRRHAHPGGGSKRFGGATQLSIGPDGLVSLTRDSSETRALLLSRGPSRGRPGRSFHRPFLGLSSTPCALQLRGLGRLEEA
jgi:hypothetical protein